ncbi:MAG: aminopeptidase P family protein [Lachnospiraceae bacterium]|nr:aminopeptidase P family protein [Lachnospiraceae bacterium]
MTKNRLNRLRIEMDKAGVDIYVMTLADYHMSEYVGDYFKEIEFISGFTGTNATMVVTHEEAGLWTDGRYFIQARQQLSGTTIRLYEEGTEGLPTVMEFLEKHLSDKSTLGFDGRLFSLEWYEKVQKLCDAKGAMMLTDENLVSPFFKNRPPLPQNKVWILEDKYSGRSCADKLSDVRAVMKERGADGFLLTSLYDIAWLLNLRGDDIHCVPVFMSYLYMTMDSCTLYADSRDFDESLMKYLSAEGIELRPYDRVYSDLNHISEKNVIIDPRVVNSELVNEFPSQVKLIRCENPTRLMKAVKNPVEVANTRKAHLEDGVAVTRFIYWLKHSIGVEEITEMSAADKLLEFRKAAFDFLDISFDTISAYRENAALMHYEPGHDHEVELHPEGMLLVDSGGHYLNGTTDVTRTIVLGDISDKEKECFTRVLRSHLRLLSAHFPKGVCGANLDALARGPMWDLGLDYRCGTGHGVGHILNVHEGPNAFRWNPKNPDDLVPLVPGMITSDEPGLYFEDEFGIRTESELLVVEDQKTEYGQFYRFEDLTYAPIDLDAVIPEKLTQYERKALNAYHADVYEALAPLLPKDEAAWLKEATRAV